MRFDEVEKFLKGKEIIDNNINEEDFTKDDVLDLAIGMMFYSINSKGDMCYICIDPFEGYYPISVLVEILKLNAFKNAERNESVKQLKAERWI